MNSLHSPSSPIGSLLAEQSFDLLAESLAPPEELSGAGEPVEDGGFPSRASVLPDEMRGALLLPSESGSLSTLQTVDNSLSSSPHKAPYQDHAGTQNTPSDASGRSQSNQAPAAATIGIGASEVSSSLCSSSKTDRSKDWSLSDTDLRELLEQDVLHEVGAVGPNQRLATVPESRPDSREPGGVLCTGHDDFRVHSDPSSSNLALRSGHAGLSTPAGSSASPSVHAHSTPTTAGSSPAPSSSARSQPNRPANPNQRLLVVRNFAFGHSSPSGTVCTASGTTSSPSQVSSLTTHTATYSSLPARSSAASSLSTVGIQSQITEDDLLEIECLEASVRSGS